jgi:DNA-binding NarL/FixJ family response regulator
MNIEVLVADDHAIIRDGLKKILADTDDMVVAGEAANGAETLEKIRARDWSVVVLDLSMPGRNGLELIRLIRAERPKLPILVFSMHSEEQFAVRAIRSGASGYLTKETDSDLLLPAIREVAAGGMYFSQKVVALLAADVSKPVASLPHSRLTDREFDIFMRIVKGVSPADIAADLSLSVKTVSSHKSHIIEKMGLSSQVDLVRYAMEHGLLGNNPR